MSSETNRCTPDSLRQKILHGSVWLFALRIVSRGLGFLRILILARLLSPEDFGLMGIAMLAMALLETFSQTGFQAALIQKKENAESYLDTVWTVLAIRSVLLFAILYVSAPSVATFFDTPDSRMIIRVVALSLLLTGFRNVGMVFFQKELEFRKLFVYELTAVVADLVMAVILAYVLRSVWALVLGGLSANVARLVLSYILHPHRPSVSFDTVKFKELAGYGKWVAGSGILVFLITQGDDIFVGKLLGVASLGIYQLAYMLSNTPATEITHAIAQVMFPVYSKLQDDSVRLGDAYLKAVHVISLASLPLSIGIFVFSHDFVKYFLGEKWMSAVSAIQILVVAGLVRSLAAAAGYVFYAVGKTRIDTMLQVVRLSVLAVTIWPLAMKFGLEGVSVAVLLSILVSYAGFAIFAIRVVNCDAKPYVINILVPLVNGAIAGMVATGLNAVLGNGAFQLAVSISVFVLAYGFGIYISDRLSNRSFLKIRKSDFWPIAGGG